MPSHGGRGRGLYASAPFDITELDFSDNLQSPQGVILEAECLAARAYGAERTLFYAGGATDAVQTALLCVKGGKVAFLGDMHKSFYAAARLFSVDFVKVDSVEDLAKVSFDALAVTSPNYFGEVREIEPLAALCAEKKAKLIVDEAHGAHFAFSSLLPKSSVKCADFTIHGMHKTLPVYTGGALLHVKEAAYAAATAARAEVVGTSPSYLVMASMDYARDLFEREGEELYKRVYETVRRVKEKYKALSFLENDDFSRLVMLRKGGGKALAAELERHGVYAEASDADQVTFIVTPYNHRALETACRIAANYDGKNAEYPDLSALIGKISARDVGIYPPGVPLVLEGETFTAEKVARIEENLDRLFGTVNGTILTK